MSYIDSAGFVWAYIFTVGPIVVSILIWLLAQDARKKAGR